MAQEGNIIVVVPQYRLGVLGYLPPSSAPSSKDPNLGVGDVVLALRWLRNSARDFGGDGGKVVVGGQSSGAHLIRGMLSHLKMGSG
jgi:carboxylesterase type B